jgi:hypothetical protein
MVALAIKSGLGPTADLLFGIAQKVGKKASPCTPLLPPVLATGGMRQRRTLASLTLRTVCADDASTTARRCAPRRGLKGRLARQQLCGESLASYGLEPVNRYLSTLGVFCDLALIEWAFQEKAARRPEGSKRTPSSRDAHSASINVHFLEARNRKVNIGAKHSDCGAGKQINESVQ